MLQRTARAALAEVIERYGKMAFVSGPRQVGKTTLAQDYRKRFSQSLYLNWDVLPDQKKVLKDPYFFEKENRDPHKPFLVILDEIHKYVRWKNYLKGAYDRYKEEFRFLITGSGRLELFKKGGDSLLGRYFSLPLFPLTMGELQGRTATLADFKRNLADPPPAEPEQRDLYRTLFEFSGFPEPYVRASQRFYNRWFEERKTLLIREDIRNATPIRELSLMETLAHLLPERVGSPLSLNALRENVGVAFETIRDWIGILDQFFYLFRLFPFTGKLTRSLKKEGKVYLYDWVEVPTEGYRFENLVGLHLFKAVRFWKATGEGRVALYYLRDKEKREVDFVVTENERPLCLVECKANDPHLAPALVYFQRKLDVPVAVQVLHQGGICKKLTDGPFTRWILSADRWLSILP